MVSVKKLIWWQMREIHNAYLQRIIYQIITHRRKTSIDENLIIEASRRLFYFWIILYDISVCESFVRFLFPPVHRASL